MYNILISPEILSNWRFHHLGIACQNILIEMNSWAGIGYVSEGESFIDPIQGVKGLFLIGPGPRLELLEDLPGERTLSPWLNKGIKIYHQAFEVDDLDFEIKRLINLRAHVVIHPIASVAFDGRRISFLMLRNMALIELVGE